MFDLLIEPGDVSLSAEDRPPPTKPAARTNAHVLALPKLPPVERVDFPPSPDDRDEAETLADERKELHEDHSEPKSSWLGGEQALKFLLAGGVAGAGMLACTSMILY
jgi:solute carrier family 25 phosphate transporter 23/24/25/41